MAINSPNKERIDAFEERVLERFNHERMEEWPLERLHEARHLLEFEFMLFKNTFPSNESVLQGDMRAYVMDNPNDKREALTNDEQLRLRHIKRTVLGELNRAEGKRKDDLREHRLKVYNIAADFISAVGKAIRSLLP